MSTIVPVATVAPELHIDKCALRLPLFGHSIPTLSRRMLSNILIEGAHDRRIVLLVKAESRWRVNIRVTLGLSL